MTLPRKVYLPLFLLLAACHVGSSTPKHPVTRDVPKSFSQKGIADNPDRWWTTLNDPTLNQLMDRALDGNPSLLATWSRLDQARLAAQREGVSRFPSVNYSGSSSLRTSGDGEGVVTNTGVSIGLSASYEVDLWGKLAAGRDIAAIGSLSAEANLKAAAITLSAQVATTWFDIVKVRQEIDLLSTQAQTATQTTTLVKLRYDNGLAPETDYLAQQQSLEALTGDRALLDAQLRVLENQLAILLGEMPGTAVPRGNGLPATPALPKTGVPADTLSRRPDVLASFLAVEVADKQVAIAAANRLPSLNLSASISTSGPQGLFTSFVSNLAAGLAGPLFDAGGRKIDEQKSRAVVIEKLHLYRQQVLDAMGEVEAALIQEQKQSEYLVSLHKQLTIAKQVFDKTKLSYEVGSADYLRVLNAQNSLQSLERRVLASQRSILGYRIALHRALAGGWEMSRPQR